MLNGRTTVRVATLGMTLSFRNSLTQVVVVWVVSYAFVYCVGITHSYQLAEGSPKILFKSEEKPALGGLYATFLVRMFRYADSIHKPTEVRRRRAT